MKLFLIFPLLMVQPVFGDSKQCQQAKSFFVSAYNAFKQADVALDEANAEFDKVYASFFDVTNVAFNKGQTNTYSEEYKSALFAVRKAAGLFQETIVTLNRARSAVLEHCSLPH